MSSGWSPFLASSSADVDESDRALLGEVEALERAVREHGPLERRELAKRVGSRFWGPGRYRPALRAALLEGRIVRVRRGVYGPPPG
jgi:hypothetical protein